MSNALYHDKTVSPGHCPVTPVRRIIPVSYQFVTPMKNVGPKETGSRIGIVLTLVYAFTFGLPGFAQESVSTSDADDLVAPIEIGPREQVGKEALGRKAARKAVGGVLGRVLGGGGRRSSAPEGPRTRRDPTRRDNYVRIEQPETGIKAGARARWADDGLVVSTRISDHDEKGTYHSVYLQSCDGRRLYPRRLEVYDLWAEHSLTVSWSRTTYSDGQVISRESGGWSDSWTQHLGRHEVDQSELPGIWQMHGYSRAHTGIQQLGAYFNLGPGQLAELGELALIAHISRPEQDPVVTAPFHWLISSDTEQPRVLDPSVAVGQVSDSRSHWQDWQDDCRYQKDRRDTVIVGLDQRDTVAETPSAETVPGSRGVKRPVSLEILDAPKLYFQDQTTDRLITFRVLGPQEMTVTRLTAIWEPLLESWKGVTIQDMTKESNDAQGLTCLSERYEIDRTRPESTPVNTITYFRLQESEFDKLVLKDCLSGDVASSRPPTYPITHGRWQLRAVVSLADGIETVHSTNLCRTEEQPEWVPCEQDQRRMRLVRHDAQIMEVGCNRDLDHIWVHSSSEYIWNEPQAGTMQPERKEEIRLKTRWRSLQIPFAGNPLSVTRGYGDPLYPVNPTAVHNNPELLVDFHVGPAVSAADLPRGDLKLPAGTRSDWSGLTVKLDSYHDIHFWENLATDTFEDLWLAAATIGFGGAPIGVEYVLGSTSKHAISLRNKKITDDLAKLALEAAGQIADRKIQKLLNDTGASIPVNATSAVGEVFDWRAEDISFKEQSVAKAYSGYEYPDFLDPGPPSSGERMFLFHLFSSSGGTVEVASYNDRDFSLALSNDVEYSAPTPDTPYPHLRFFLGGVVAIGSSNKINETRIAETIIRRVAPDHIAPVRIDFGEGALHNDCAAFNPPPRPGLDPTFLEIQPNTIDRPTEAMPRIERPTVVEPPSSPGETGNAEPPIHESGESGFPSSDVDAGDEPENAPSFTFARPASRIVTTAGANAPSTFSAQLRSQNDFEGPVTIKIGPLPGPGWGVEWDASVVLQAGGAARTRGSLIVDPDVEPGIYQVTLLADGNGVRSTHNLDVQVR